MAREPLYIDIQCYKIAQSNAVKVLLRHLERRYIAIDTYNHADSINGMCFLSKKISLLA